MVEPLVVKDSFLRGSPIFSQKVAKRPPWQRILPQIKGDRNRPCLSEGDFRHASLHARFDKSRLHFAVGQRCVPQMEPE